MRLTHERIDARGYIEQEVQARLIHETAESVRTTCSFARAERLLGREYHGRFLIELIQNAADAWRSRPDPVEGERSPLKVILEDGPDGTSLVVANRGQPLTAQVVIESLGHVGASTKAEGEAIGHKGIGFKSVLEVCATPEIYSGLKHDDLVAVRFDADLAQRRIVEVSGDVWAESLLTIDGLDASDPVTAVPVLRYPSWVAEAPAVVNELATDGFETVIRLPMAEKSAASLHVAEDQWLSLMRGALGQVTDQMLLLLGTFEEIVIEDRLAGTRVVIRQDIAQSVGVSDGCFRQDISVLRDGAISSSWYLYRNQADDQGDLANEIAFGVRHDGAERPVVQGSFGTAESSTFHLFFPTRISTGTPFLLHGYFKVDAARTSFYPGAAASNRRVLAALIELAADAVVDLRQTTRMDFVSFVERLAACAEPDDPMASAFRIGLLEALDDVEWVPVRGSDGDATRRPLEALVSEGDFTPLVNAAFPPSYVEQVTGRSLPSARLSARALELVASRRERDASDLWRDVETLMLPGDLDPWAQSQIEECFRGLLDLLTALRVHDRARCELLLASVRGNPASRLLPVTSGGDQLELVSVPDLSEGRPGRRSRAVMARVRSGGAELIPPSILDLGFLPDGCLTSESELDQAKPFGVRPFTADNVLDRLNGVRPDDDEALELIAFLWRMLHQTAGAFSIKHARHQAWSSFEPHTWFWCQPSQGADSSARPVQQRARYLATVPVPCRDGQWRPAGEVCFGADWADWIDGLGNRASEAYVARAPTYRAMEVLAPGPHALLASPQSVAGMLATVPHGSGDTIEPDVEGQDLDEDVELERHAFLLRLGVWEVPPIEAFENREKRPAEERLPWDKENADEWRFGLDGWSGKRHAPSEVHLGEDYRFVWSLRDVAFRGTAELMTASRAASRLYGERRNALFYCTGCSDSGTNHLKKWRSSVAADGYQSELERSLRSDAWLPGSRDGQAIETPVPPVDVRWHQNRPAGSGLRQSPYRFLTLCGPEDGVNDQVRDLAGLTTVEDAPADVVRRLLASLATSHDERAHESSAAPDGQVRQGVIGLHRILYERVAQLAGDASEAASLLPEEGLLCQVGESLEYRPPGEARHDDGSFARYARHFSRDVPLLALPRGSGTTARALGVRGFEVELRRDGSDDGSDVTSDAHALLEDRFAEILAIIVHHRLGGQTVEVTSNEFALRVARLRALRVRQVEDLVVTATVAGVQRTHSLGEGANQDVFLDMTTPSRPVLWHDFNGLGWQDRLRRKLGPELAALLDNAAYGATFGLFLQLETDLEREEHLLDLGISPAAVALIASRLGVVNELERELHRRWFVAVCLTRRPGWGPESLDSLDTDVVERELRASGLDEAPAHALALAGGGPVVRRDVSDDAPLTILRRCGTDLALLNENLVAQGSDDGLDIPVARTRLRRWVDSHGRQVAAVLHARGVSPDEAKSALVRLSVPERLIYELDPHMTEILAPVVEVLRSNGASVTAQQLGDNPRGALARAGGFESVEQLDDAASLLFSPEEQGRLLRARATTWREVVRRLAVLSRTDADARPTVVRSIDDEVARQLSVSLERPTDLHGLVDDLFTTTPRVAELLKREMRDDLNAPSPDLDSVLVAVVTEGMSVEHRAHVDRVLQARRSADTDSVRRRATKLNEWALSPKVPALSAVTQPVLVRARSAGDVKNVATVKVGETHDRRKRELGDEGEAWALASTISRLIALSPGDRVRAIDEVVGLLTGVSAGVRFESANRMGVTGSVESVLAHAEPAKLAEFDEDDLIDELTGLLHVSKESDGFGFDLIGWASPGRGEPETSMCLEVKSSGAQPSFHLTLSEWQLAKQFHLAGHGHRYGVLVVRRSRDGSRLTGMDLLVDPVSLFESGLLRRDADGYIMGYETQTR